MNQCSLIIPESFSGGDTGDKMAFGRKKKGEPLSRYDRQEEGFLDDEEQELYTRTGADFSDAGYGVRDSYSRQASYGRRTRRGRTASPRSGWRSI